MRQYKNQISSPPNKNTTDNKSGNLALQKQATDNTPTANKESSEVRRIFQSIKTYFDTHLTPKRMQAYKDYLLNKVDRQLEIQEFQTNIKMPIVKMYIDAMWTGVYDNNLEMRVSGRTKEDHKKARAVLQYNQWGFSVSNSREQFMQSVKEALILGDGYGRIGFIDDTQTITYNKGLKKVTTERKEQYPYIKYCSAFDIFHDPTVEHLEDSRYVIYRKIMYKDDFKKQYGPYLKEKGIMDKIEDALRSPFYFFTYDFSRVKYLAFWGQETIDQYIERSQLDEFNMFFKNYLTVDYSGGYLELVEYWEDDVFKLIVNGHVIYSGNNPLPIKKKPFYEIHYNKIPGIPFGMGMALSLSDIQKISDTIVNLTIDNLKLQIAPMFQKVKGGDIFEDGESVISYTPFKVIETNQPGAIQRLELGIPDFSGTNFMQFLMQLGEMSEGVNSYAIGYQNKVERSATGVSALVQSFKARLLPLTDSMNQALAKISEIWTGIGIAVLPEEISIRIQDDKDKTTFADIKLEDLIGRFDFEFDPQALKTATRETKRKQLMDLMATAAQSGIDPNTQTYFINMQSLWKELLDAFELPSNEIISEPIDVVKSQVKFENKKKQIIMKNQSGGFSDTAYETGRGGILPLEGQQGSGETEDFSGTPADRPTEGPAESEVLREAFGRAGL